MSSNKKSEKRSALAEALRVGMAEAIGESIEHDPTPTHTAAMSLERISELEAMAERCRSAQTQATLNMHDIGNRAAMAAGAYTSALIAAAPALLRAARDAAAMREALEKIVKKEEENYGPGCGYTHAYYTARAALNGEL